MKKAVQEISIDMLRELFKLNAETGVIDWCARPARHFRDTPGRTAAHSANRFNSQLAGKPAFTSKHQLGYLRAEVNHKLFQAHRVAFALFHGAWPDGVIDHINGDPSDNRPSNLRDVTQTENMRNTALRRNNKSGRVGVHIHKQSGKWQASIRIDGKHKYLGLFDSIDEAANVRAHAEVEHGYHQNHGRKAA